MTFSIIGSGNIAWFLGGRLAAAGHRCSGIYSRNTDAAMELADVLNCIAYRDVAQIKDEEADLCFVAVKAWNRIPAFRLLRLFLFRGE